MRRNRTDVLDLLHPRRVRRQPKEGLLVDGVDASWVNVERMLMAAAAGSYGDRLDAWRQAVAIIRIRRLSRCLPHSPTKADLKMAAPNGDLRASPMNLKRWRRILPLGMVICALLLDQLVTGQGLERATRRTVGCRNCGHAPAPATRRTGELPEWHCLPLPAAFYRKAAGGSFAFSGNLVFVGQIIRYLPGRVWHLLYQASLTHTSIIPRSVLLRTNLEYMAVMTWTAVFVPLSLLRMATQ